MAIAILPAHASYLRPSDGHAADLDSALPRILSKPAAVQVRTTTDNHTWRLVATVLLPFAAGYYLSYVFRTINALISGPLATEFGLSAADLGILTAVLFLTFGALQLPLGAWLDRFGPRRVQAGLLSLAAIGATIFACAPNLLWLILGRALIGLGVAGALMGGLKAIVLWWPAKRIALANGWLITLGALGAVTATAPAEMLIAPIGWRGLFLLLAILAAIAAVLILRFVPDRPAGGPDNTIGADTTIRTIYRDARFWRLAPLSATTIGSAWALQGLWAGPWLADVEGLPRRDVVMHLLVMAMALSASAFALGTAGDRLRRRGFSLSTTLAFATGLALLAQLSIALRLPVPTWLPWIAVAGIGAGTVLSYAIVAELFPKSASGRANGALNLLHIGSAFAVQVGIGFIVDLWPVESGRHPPLAYQTALGINLALQVAAFLWFVRPRRRAVPVKDLPAHPIHGLAVTLGVPCADAVPYLQARQDWRSRQMIAQRQVSAWRSAALVSVVIMAAIGSALATLLSTTSALPYLPQSHATSSGNDSVIAAQSQPAPKTAIFIPSLRKE
ncbi:MAG: MFS transporter [Hyphomicrobiaceae bacterium]